MNSFLVLLFGLLLAACCISAQAHNATYDFVDAYLDDAAAPNETQKRQSGNYYGPSYFYNDPDFTGTQYTLYQGWVISDLAGTASQDRISGFIVMPNTEVIVCEHRNFGGYCETYSAYTLMNAVPYLRRIGSPLNDRISSIRSRFIESGGSGGK